jgi:hypothetical protein
MKEAIRPQASGFMSAVRCETCTRSPKPSWCHPAMLKPDA